MKKKLIRSVLFVVIALVVLVVVGMIGVALLADRAVKRAVESAGTKALTVPVAVDKADVSILGGALGLRGIVVANPPGYVGAALVTLEHVEIEADTRSLLSDEVLITDMRLKNMVVFVEQNGLDNNLYEVVKVVRQRPKPVGRKLLIDRLEITDVSARIDLPSLPGKPETVTIQIEPITMTGLGRDERLDTAVLISKILLAVAAGVAQQGGDVLPEEMVTDLTSILGSVIDIGRVIFGPGGDSQGRNNGAAELGQKVTEGLKNLLAPKERQ
jgi:hypothetical protein